MKTIKYANDDIERRYKKVVKKTFGFETVIEQLFETDDMVVVDVYDDQDMIEMLLKVNEKIVKVEINYNDKIASFMCNDWLYTILYRITPTKLFIPLGYKYINGNRNVVSEKSIRFSSSSYTVHVFKLQVDDDIYEIMINEGEEQIIEEQIILSLINPNNRITRIKDILEILSHCLSLASSEIKIKKYDDKGSIVIVYKGTVTKYVEYLKEDDIEMKIYLEDGKFFVKKTIREEVDDVIPFVKKIGENNG